jgi:uncharacterized protein (DUF2235 family)
MTKNIIICSDGIGNTAIKGRGTNVFKIFEAADLNRHRYDAALVPQVAIYDDGVGGAARYGLGRNARQLYEEPCRIFPFGFSRGAFTVRTPRRPDLHLRGHQCAGRVARLGRRVRADGPQGVPR